MTLAALVPILEAAAALANWAVFVVDDEVESFYGNSISENHPMSSSIVMVLTKSSQKKKLNKYSFLQ